ncbi:hypothetical protein [Alteribacter keqinensis]|uniref:hypothetical protein n=1 Tax=Alteribacter keqinensis TaxID=2483800 RepID=UPI001605BB54|nr:hypothetical protein [Alteribacter keqinensis]
MERRKWNKVQVIAVLWAVSCLAFFYWLASREVSYSNEIISNYVPFVLLAGFVMTVHYL